jgi:hypothetical protein
VRDEDTTRPTSRSRLPDFVEIDGVRYVKTGDGATLEASNVG